MLSVNSMHSWHVSSQSHSGEACSQTAILSLLTFTLQMLAVAFTSDSGLSLFCQADVYLITFFPEYHG